MRRPDPRATRAWLIWTAGFLAFPVAGIASTAVAGRVDSPLAALSGGAFAGLVIGAGHALVSRRRPDPRRWIPASAVGMSLGLLLGAAAVGYRTSLARLALMGAVTGIVLGAAQTLALPVAARRRWVWAAAFSALSGLLPHIVAPLATTVDGDDPRPLPPQSSRLRHEHRRATCDLRDRRDGLATYGSQRRSWCRTTAPYGSAPKRRFCAG